MSRLVALLLLACLTGCAEPTDEDAFIRDAPAGVIRLGATNQDPVILGRRWVPHECMSALIGDRCPHYPGVISVTFDDDKRIEWGNE